MTSLQFTSLHFTSLHSLTHFTHFTSLHSQPAGRGSTAMVVTTAGALQLLPKIERGFGTERARLGTFRGSGTERARLGT